jgi:hypothetical protein
LPLLIVALSVATRAVSTGGNRAMSRASVTSVGGSVRCDLGAAPIEPTEASLRAFDHVGRWQWGRPMRSIISSSIAETPHSCGRYRE